MTVRDPGDWKALAALRLAQIHAALAGYEADFITRRIDRHCESPIEKMLAAAFVSPGLFPRPSRPMLDFGHDLIDTLEDLVGWFYDVLRDGLRSPLNVGLDGCWTAMIRPQVKIGPYRLDFALVAAALSHDCEAPEKMPLLKIAIECDGHDFHERTKEQAERDRARDRFLQGEGLTVLRFTGSEIWRSPEGCRDEVVDHVKRWAEPIVQKFEQEFLAQPLKRLTQETEVARG